MNVLDNALEVSPADSEVTVALSASDDAACVTVTDSGPGVAPGERERIFDPFYSNKPAGCGPAGAGLGLAIARSIAREHGGDLAARSEPSAGATFELSLPLSPGSPERAHPTTPRIKSPRLGGARRTARRHRWAERRPRRRRCGPVGGIAQARDRPPERPAR